MQIQYIFNKYYTKVFNLNFIHSLCKDQATGQQSDSLHEKKHKWSACKRVHLQPSSGLTTFSAGNPVCNIYISKSPKVIPFLTLLLSVRWWASCGGSRPQLRPAADV